MKTGKQPPKHDPRTLTFESYTLKPPRYPTSDTDNLRRFSDWGVLANDRYGDCVWAGAAHETMNWTATAGHPVRFDDQDVLGDYSAVTGFQAGDPSTDQGTSVLDALNYRRHTGIADAKGTRHKLGGFVALEHGHPTHVKEALYLFDAVGIGFEFPGSAMDQFNAGRPWTVVPGATVDGGHYVPAIGYDSRFVYVVTWGKVQRMSWGFFAKYADEVFALFSTEYLKGGKSPEGWDKKALLADLAAL